MSTLPRVNNHSVVEVSVCHQYPQVIFVHKYSSRADKSTSNKVTEDVDQLNPEEDSEHFMAILIECLGLLGELNESVEVSYSLILYRYAVQ